MGAAAAIEPGAHTADQRVSRSSVRTVAWVPVADMEYLEWADTGRWLGAIGRCNQWWLGDWIRYGTAKYGEKYLQAAELTGYDVHSLRNMAYVASRFSEVSRRRDNLSWSHHAELAPLAPDRQDEWLRRASDQRLSVARLRSELHGSRHGPDESPDVNHRPSDTDDVPEVVVCPNCGHRYIPAKGDEMA